MSRLFEDIIEVVEIDPDGKKFDKVSRIQAKAEKYQMKILVDINTEIYPVRRGNKFALVLAKTLDLDGTPDSGYYIQSKSASLADKYEYVAYGKIYKISEDSTKSGKAEASLFASFHGLQMQLTGDPSCFQSFELDQMIFLLLRKL